MSDTLECRKESEANVSHCDCDEKENRQKKKMRHLAGSLEGVFEKIQQLSNISAAIEAHKMCWGGGGIKRMRLHLIFFEVALAIKCGSW